MERKQYLDLCQQQAVKGDVLVTYNGISYQPMAYQLGFHSDGKVRHTAVLVEPGKRTMVYCRLEDVKEK